MALGFDWLYIADIQSTFCPMNTLHPRNHDLQYKIPYTVLVFYLQLLSLDYELFQALGFDWLYIANIQSTFCPMNTFHPRNQDLQYKIPCTVLVFYLQLLSLDYELTHHSLAEV